MRNNALKARTRRQELPSEPDLRAISVTIGWPTLEYANGGIGNKGFNLQTGLGWGDAHDLLTRSEHLADGGGTPKKNRPRRFTHKSLQKPSYLEREVEFTGVLQVIEIVFRLKLQHSILLFAFYELPLRQDNQMTQNGMSRLFSRLPGGGYFQTSANEDRFRRLESRLDYLEGIRIQWETHLPQLLNQVDRLTAAEKNLLSIKVGHVAVENECNNLTKSVQDIWQRLEVNRTEALLAIRYGEQKSEIVKSKIVNKTRLKEFQISGLKVNLGCGHIPLAEYINVDARELPGVDVVSDVSELPFAKGAVQTIFSSHLLEHFPQEELKRRLLPYWFTVLSLGGEFRAIVPDGEAMLKSIGAGTYAYEDFRQVLFGGQDYEGDFHFNLFTPESLEGILVNAGFTNVRCHAKGRQNGQCLEFEMSAEKPRKRSR